MSTRLAVDTSVAVALLVASHSGHDSARVWARGKELALAGHAALETYSVLTRLPGSARVAPSDAILLIDGRFIAPLTLPARTAAEAYREFARLGICGGAVYDALVALAAREAGLPLVSADLRAIGIYDLLGVKVELLGIPNVETVGWR